MAILKTAFVVPVFIGQHLCENQQGFGLQCPQPTEILGKQISGIITTGRQEWLGGWGSHGLGVHRYKPPPHKRDSADSSVSC